MRLKWGALALVLAWGSASSARAESPELKHDWAVDGAITAAGAAGWLATETLFKSQLAPKSCRWCDRDAAGNDTLNGFDRGVRDALVWHDTKLADVLSNVTALGLVPIATLGGTALAAHRDGSNRNIASDLLVVSEVVALAEDVDQVVKFSVGRERPFVHRLPPDQKLLTDKPTDNNLSFYSGHTTWAFAMATAAGTVCSMHHYDFAPEVWAAGLTLATGTALLRIGADKHYATDVLTGAAIGTALGIGVPRLFHSPRSGQPSSQGALGLSAGPLPGGVSLALSGRF